MPDYSHWTLDSLSSKIIAHMPSTHENAKEFSQEIKDILTNAIAKPDSEKWTTDLESLIDKYNFSQWDMEPQVPFELYVYPDMAVAVDAIAKLPGWRKLEALYNLATYEIVSYCGPHGSESQSVYPLAVGNRAFWQLRNLVLLSPKKEIDNIPTEELKTQIKEFVETPIIKGEHFARYIIDK